ncbi:MAG: hypothetical protein BGN86_12510 [Caulobacterales bacterium 68-7]|nr:MAG: hypothetical protein BGN86_12510 [Caulobacterales bacterium 68-7]
MKPALALTLVAFATAAMACSPASNDPESAGATSPVASSSASAPLLVDEAKPAASSESRSARVLTLSGLRGLKIGEPVPLGGQWSTPVGDVGDGCHAVRSADFPGVLGLVEDGKVRRITLGSGSDVKLAEGIGVGASEAEIEKRFAGFRSESHKYEAAPAKYLTAPNADRGGAALRFEIGGDGKAKAVHVGMMPQLAYVEGCG